MTDKIKINHSPLIVALLVFLVSAVYFSSGTSFFGPFDYDEAIYLETAREMMLSKDYILPSYNYNRFYEKPPLLYWVTIGSHLILPTKDISHSARLAQAYVAALTASLVCLFVLYTGGNLMAGILSAAVFATSFGQGALSRAILTDGIFTLALVGAIFSGIIFIETAKKKFSFAFWTLTALSTLAKGPAGAVFAVGTVFLCGWFSRRRFFEALKITFDPLGVALFLALALPWYLAAYIKSGGEALRDFLIVHNIKRFAATSFEGHSGPFFYYLPVIVVWFFPWIFFLPSSIFYGLRGEDNSRRKFLMYCIIGAGLPLLIFSLSKTKLPNYIAPAFPFLSAITGLFISDNLSKLDEQEKSGGAVAKILSFIVGVSVGLTLALVFGGAPAWFNKNIEKFSDAMPFMEGTAKFTAGISFGVISLAVFIATLCGAALLFYRAKKNKIFFWLLGCAAVVGLSIPYAARDVWVFVQKPLKEAAVEAGRYCDDDYTLIAYKLMMSPSIVLYTGRKVNFVSSENEIQSLERTDKATKNFLLLATKKDFRRDMNDRGFKVIKEFSGYVLALRKNNE